MWKNLYIPNYPLLLRLFVKLKASCVFQVPQFDSKLVKIVVEGTNAQIGTLDPLGVNVSGKEDFYLQLLRNMSKSLKECLG